MGAYGRKNHSFSPSSWDASICTKRTAPRCGKITIGSHLFQKVNTSRRKNNDITTTGPTVKHFFDTWVLMIPKREAKCNTIKVVYEASLSFPRLPNLMMKTNERSEACPSVNCRWQMLIITMKDVVHLCVKCESAHEYIHTHRFCMAQYMQSFRPNSYYMFASKGN